MSTDRYTCLERLGLPATHDFVRPRHSPMHWRARWIAEGCRWWSRVGPPDGWSTRRQLANIGIAEGDAESA